MAVGLQISLNVQFARAVARLRRLNVSLDQNKLLTAVGLRHLKWMNDNLRVAGLDAPHRIMSPNTIAGNPRRESARHFSSRWRSRLNQSFNIVLRGSSVSAGTNIAYAAIQHTGTRPYTIRPRNAAFLRFKVAGGRTVFTQRVSHPGIPPRPLLPTKRSGEALAKAVLEAYVARAVAAATTGP